MADSIDESAFLKEDKMSKLYYTTAGNLFSVGFGNYDVDYDLMEEIDRVKKDIFYENYFARISPFKRGNPEIKNVIFNEPATIVFWSDGTKTVVKADNEPFDPEKGLAMAVSKKMLGDNKSSYYNIFKIYLKK